MRKVTIEKWCFVEASQRNSTVYKPNNLTRALNIIARSGKTFSHAEPFEAVDDATSLNIGE